MSTGKSLKKSLKGDDRKLPTHLQHINPLAAGIDIGSRSYFVAVPEGLRISLNPATDSTPYRPVIPLQSGQFVGA